MSADKKPYRTITEQEVLDYLDGKLKGKEANEVERHLVSTEFDEEAMEGLAGVETGILREDLNRLRTTLTKKADKIPFNYFQLAATLAFLMISMVAIWFVVNKALPNDRITLKNDAVEEESAPQEPTPEDAAIAIVEADEPEEQLDETIVDSVFDAEEESFLAESLEPEADTLGAVEAYDTVESALALADVPSEDLLTDTADLPLEFAQSIAKKSVADASILDGSIPTESLNAAGAVSRAAAAPVEAVPEPSVKGTIYFREDGEPLAGVTVNANNKSTISELNGRFELSGVDSSDQVTFSYVGMKSKMMDVKNDEPLVVVMDADNSALEEVVVVGYGETGSAGFKSPEPENGTAAFKDYLKNSLQYPAAARQNQVSGVVVLKVTISSGGSIHNIEVKKSLGHGCDEEAIRLIREGPKWNPSLYDGEPVEGAVRVRVRFGG